ncbi:UDP-glucose:(heptosyl)LPS alpha-1,3-glucosyltransferase [Lebetimonas natsushimae]|uniref:UDP-glucose:(Heptosyl)LPS alpha-1,3-glucosyltransferase n=1 Tax=Lebetimonas natsushimae TaxID=1936991 RepID=A0A292YBC6_9BACT|nr:glycosyltransferase family 4 protein [Lebetimonas natsushimae]GAX86811.1 UDP-glucose:(heptosyl)LPS alpha-1,3-glucosyltransferase [Lebetimonas natsushimae]
MKITFLRLKKNPFGGAERYLERLSNELKKENIDFEIINCSCPKFIPGFLKAIWFNVQVCLNKKDKFYFSLERITCPDIYRAGDGVHRAFLEIKKSFNPLHFVYLFIEKRMFKNAKKIIANSKMVKNQIIKYYGIDENKIKVIYNGIPLKEKVDFSDIKKEFNLNNEKIILFVGSGFERKGVKKAIDIVSNIKGNFKFIVVGKEKNISFYKNYAKEKGVNAIFTGPRGDVDKFFGVADIFLFPTKYEPFSNVVLEAMNFECVIFTTKQNGASEILPEFNVMENPNDLSVVEKINILFKNDKILEEKKREMKEISKQFSIEKNVRETIKVINEIFKKRY